MKHNLGLITQLTAFENVLCTTESKLQCLVLLPRLWLTTKHEKHDSLYQGNEVSEQQQIYKMKRDS